ncbi:MAG: glycoside hydrolase family protein [Gemmatimonadales bacterium]
MTITELIEQHEGRRNRVYLDPRGIPTIGVGWNLNDPDSDVIAGHFGLDLANLKSGVTLTDAQIDEVRNYQINEATLAAKRIFPNFDMMPANPQAVIVDMIFNLGEPRFSQFVNTIAQLKAGNWKQAAIDAGNSLWAKQVPNRAKDDIALLNAT